MKLLVSAEAEINAQLLSQAKSSDSGVSRTGLNDDTVNVLYAESGIGQGTLSSLHVEAQGATVRNSALGGIAQPNNGTPVFQAH